MEDELFAAKYDNPDKNIDDCVTYILNWVQKSGCNGFCEDTGCFPGRDAFIEMLRKHGLMVRIKRRRRYKTTDSDHNYRKYPNLIKGVVPTHPNQIWASDITYVETNEGVCYLSLITDLYSHKIVGWAVGPTLETVYPLEALKMAYKSIDEETAKGLIHHSDRGSQYCSQNYVSILKTIVR